MDTHLWLIYLASAIGLSLTPGPNGLLVLDHGMRFGWRQTLPTALGGVTGFMVLVGASLAGLGALLVGYFEGDDLVFAGRIGTGFDTRLLLDLRSRLDALEVPQPPFTRAVGLPRLRAHWVRPEIVVQVAFIEWTVHGKLRHPRLLGVRFDKDARAVVRETP